MGIKEEAVLCKRISCAVLCCETTCIKCAERNDYLYFRGLHKSQENFYSENFQIYSS